MLLVCSGLPWSWLPTTYRSPSTWSGRAPPCRSLKLPEGLAAGAGALDAYAIKQYCAPQRVHHAWQLVEAFRAARSTKPLVAVAVLDGGFWVDGRSPAFPLGQRGSDFGTSVMQLNLLDPGVGVGGANPSRCQAPKENPFASAYTCPWHGNAVASVAAAPVGNQLGTAGVAGTVARPVFLKSDLAQGQMLAALQLCLAWGIDIINISSGIQTPLFMYTSKGWDAQFRHAADNGVVIVVSAGNQGKRLPEELDVRPATRTPGTITVGALDGAGPRSDSNYGSSIDIWAPGTSLPVAPDPNFVFGSLASGTSVAAPFVSGVAAMIRAVAPATTAAQVKQLLTSTAWSLGPGAGAGGVNAYAAVLAALGGRLPDDPSAPDQDGTAQPMRRSGPGGNHLQPQRLDGRPLGVLSGAGDRHRYRFDVTEFAQLDLRLASYWRLGQVAVALVPEDPEARTDEVVLTPLPGSNPGDGRARLLGPVAPGGYEIHVSGGAPNLYELTVDLSPFTLPWDEFERNDTFDTATLIRLRDRGALPDAVGATGIPGGTFDLNLHDPADVDWFRVDSDSANPLTLPTIRISRADAPVIDVDIYDETHTLVDQVRGQRSPLVRLPHTSVRYLAVSAASRLTRYRLSVRLEVDPAHLPGPDQEVGVIPVPDPGDPAFGLLHDVTHVYLEVDQARLNARRLMLGTLEGRPLRAEVLDEAGAVVLAAASEPDNGAGLFDLDVSQLELGGYVLRLTTAPLNGSQVHVEGGTQLPVSTRTSSAGHRPWLTGHSPSHRHDRARSRQIRASVAALNAAGQVVQLATMTG